VTASLSRRRPETAIVMSVNVISLAAVLVATAILRTIPYSGGVWSHEAVRGESVVSIAARVGLEARTLATDNRLSVGKALSPGQDLLIDNRHLVPQRLERGILINIPQRMLFLFADGGLVRAYPVAVGSSGWQTPVGVYRVASREVDPTWDVPPSIQQELAQLGRPALTRVLPGPNNPLGDRYLAISSTGSGIHGTNQPTSIYCFSTHGCIRLHTDDVRELFERVSVGTPVHIIYRPILAVRLDADHIAVEIHADAYRRSVNLRSEMRTILATIDADDLANSQPIRDALSQQAGRMVVLEIPQGTAVPPPTW
jgi:L,D-transpeptidase ErfK/SrfK